MEYFHAQYEVYWKAINFLSPDIDGVSFEDYLRLEHIVKTLFSDMYGTEIRDEGDETEDDAWKYEEEADEDVPEGEQDERKQMYGEEVENANQVEE